MYSKLNWHILNTKKKRIDIVNTATKNGPIFFISTKTARMFTHLCAMPPSNLLTRNHFYNALREIIKNLIYDPRDISAAMNYSFIQTIELIDRVTL